MKLRWTLALLTAVFVMAACEARGPASPPPSGPPVAATSGAAPAPGDVARPAEVPESLTELQVDHVDFVAVLPPIPPGPQVPRPLYGGRAEDRPALERLLRGLAAAAPVDPTGADAEHRRMEWLDIHLIDGRRIMIRPAWNCRTEGNGMNCTTVSGKLVIAKGGSSMVVEAPDLEAFLRVGRAEAMPAVEQMTVEPGELAAGEMVTVTGDGWAGAKAYRLTLEGAGQPVTLAEGAAAFGGFTWTGRLPAELAAGEYLLQVRMDTGAGVGRPVQVAF